MIIMTGAEDVNNCGNGRQCVGPVLRQLEIHALRILSWSSDAGTVSFTHQTYPLGNELIGSRSSSGRMPKRRISAPVEN